MKKRILSILLTLCMMLCLTPISVFAEEVGAWGSAAIKLGADALSVLSKNVNTATAPTVYFGQNHDNNPAAWRVIGYDGSGVTSAQGDITLLAAGNMGVVKFADTTANNKYAPSNLKTAIDALAAKLTTEENAVVKKRTLTSGSYNGENTDCVAGAQVDNAVFWPLSIAEASAVNNDLRIADKEHTKWASSYWWLRSPGTSAYVVAVVKGNGSVSCAGHSLGTEIGVRPAFNLNLNSVLFASAAVGGKPDGGLTPIPEYSGNEWKLTLLDNSSNFAVTEKAVSAAPDDTVALHYTGASAWPNEYISAIIADSSGAQYYGRITRPAMGNGTVEIKIPSDLAPGDYTMKVFSEQYNGDYNTDYASNFTDIALTVENQPDEQFTLASGGRYYFDLSVMNISGTVNSNLPDSTLHYVPFTYVGTVNAYKLTSEMATTEEYAQKNKYPHSLFIADYAVTHTVRWDDLNTTGLIFGKNYATGGVNYTLRAPSMGSGNRGSGDIERGTPQSNEWDRILDKDSGYIKNWIYMLSLGQDTFERSTEPYRAFRGFDSARKWSCFHAMDLRPFLGFRPVLEVLNPDTLGSDGLKAVTLDLGGGTLGNSSEDIQIIVKTGSEFTAPASDGLTRPDGDAGSFFMWLGSNGKFYAPGDSVPAEVTKLTAQWTAPTYAVTLNTNGGTINSGNVTSYTYGVGATLPTAGDMTYTGHTFVGWYDNENLTGSPVTAIGGTETGNKEYWAKWEANAYTVTLNTNGGTINSGNVTEYTYGVGATLPTAGDMTYTGHTFVGWYDNENLTGSPVTAISNTETGNKEYWAKWEANTYTVTLNTNGGTINSGNVTGYTYGVGATLPTADDMTYTGHTFVGWYDNENLTGDPVTAIGGTEMGNKEYWAKWEINQYTITVKPENGKADITITQDYGTPITAPADPTREGYTFAGWDKAIPATMPAENLTITAHWSLDTYSITYNLDGGTASGNPDFYTVESSTITLNPPTRTGYTFIGWSGTDLSGSDNLTVTIPAGSIGNRSYIAHWSLNTYSITYDLDGGTALGNPDFYTVESSAITLNEPTKAGYVFTGWSGTDLVGEDNLTVTIPAGSIGDRRYTAHWEFDPTIIAALNPTPNVDFLDVSRTDWFYYDVRYVCENGLMNGTSRNRFSPYGTATRGMLVTILYRMENEPRCFGSAAFSDVKPSAYYEKAVIWASQNGIVSGYTDGTFRPDAPVTREQLASILYRYTRYRGQDVSAGETTSFTGYGDAQTVSNYALPAMRWACGTGILQGANGKLNPSGLATRAQLAAMLHRYLTK